VADTKVSGLAAAASFLTTHEIPVNEAGTSKKVTGTQILAKTAQGTMGYAQITANSATVSAQTDLITAPAVTVGTGRRIRVSAFASSFFGTVGNDVFGFEIWEGATRLALAVSVIIPTALYGAGCSCSVILLPSAAAHTYKVSMIRIAGTGTAFCYAGVTNPAYILVEDIGT
jgi:hypothetical protein